MCWCLNEIEIILLCDQFRYGTEEERKLYRDKQHVCDRWSLTPPSIKNNTVHIDVRVRKKDVFDLLAGYVRQKTLHSLRTNVDQTLRFGDNNWQLSVSETAAASVCCVEAMRKTDSMSCV